MGDKVSRRNFLGGAVTAAVAAKPGKSAEREKLPARELGRTGVRVPMLAIGCGMSLWAAVDKDEKRGIEVLNLALDSGIGYFDTGQTYGEGLSETWIGKVLKHRRKEVFVSTKTGVRNGDEAFREMEKSLKRLQTDKVDLLQIHTLLGEDDLARIEAAGGVLDALYKLRDQGVTRFIGITSHYDPVVLKTALERHDFDCTQMALNPASQGWGESGPAFPQPSFESIALPAARKKNLGVIAMKVTGRNFLIGEAPGKASFENLLRYTLSLPVSIAVVGMGKLEHVRQTAELGRRFQPMAKAAMEDLSQRLTLAHKAALDRRFLHHQDA